ncbi:efflux RND transporter periplasmic adaptor subunit [Pseudogulbenkiania sp. MAI-1]|uniref:efflux RND transporter periplasmic adaptor subunit n=1 Tax=Pseudogulbenkiania sp. MAI-1 TaxID=990370 RepID=UPI00045E85CC|nr:efflux RND transporter periplasmic adaptor subunit [Pseudogulbenkiania sp. MAI-1]
MKPYLLPIALSLLVLTACNDSSSSPATATAAKAPPPRELAASDVLVAKVVPLADTLAFTGTLNALDSSTVAAEVEAVVREVVVREGERVRRGQLLARLDHETLAQSVAEQEAQLANSRARLGLARVKLDKQRELYERGFISRLAFEEVESDFQVRAGELKAQEAQLARARKSLADTRLSAPIDGVVYQRAINPGELAQRNTPLFRIADLSVLELAASLPARFIGKLHVGQHARFTVEGLAEEFDAELVRLNPVAASGTRSFTVYLRVANPEGRLKAGQFAKGGIVLKEVDDAVSLPLSALHDAGGKPWVLLAERGKVVRRPVTVRLLAESAGRVAVDGVKPGETVLTASLLGINPGDAVTLAAAR